MKILSLLLTLSIVYPLAAQESNRDLASRALKAVSPIAGELKITGLQAPVKVARDQWGVAHIYAANQHDLFFAQGFAAAQDRLFQMEMWKRAGVAAVGLLAGVVASFVGRRR